MITEREISLWHQINARQTASSLPHALRFLLRFQPQLWWQHHTISHWWLLSSHMLHIPSYFLPRTFSNTVKSTCPACEHSPVSILPVATPNYWEMSQWVYKYSCFPSPKLTIFGIQVDILSTSQYKLAAAQIKSATTVAHLHANFHYILFHLTCSFFLLPGSSPIWTTCTQVLVLDSTFKGAQSTSGNC